MTVLRETSDRSPALATFNARLFIAWKGNGNFHLNVMSSDRLAIPPPPDVGSAIPYPVHFDSSRKRTLDEYTPVGPALAAFNGRLFMAWTGIDEFAQLNVISSADGVTWRNQDKVVVREDSRYGPALCAFQGRLYMAWTGVDEFAQLNVISSVDGVNWRNEDKVVVQENSIATPALVSIHDPLGHPADRLYLSWTGTDRPNHLNLLSSSDGTTFSNKVILNLPISEDIHSEEATSFAGPALTRDDGPAPEFPGSIPPYLYIAWTELGNDHHLRLTEYPQSLVSGLGARSIAAPALVQGEHLHLFIAWTGTDDEHHLNVSDVFNLSPRGV
jgi:hypothetical protein